MRAVPLEWGQIPRAGGSTGLRRGLVILWGGCQVGVSGFPLSHRTLLSFLACPSLLSLSHSLCFQHLLQMRMWSICKKMPLVQCGAFKPLSCGFPKFHSYWLYLTVGSCMVEGNSQLLMCKQTLGLLALFLLYCCLVTKWFGRAKGQTPSSLFCTSTSE